MSERERAREIERKRERERERERAREAQTTRKVCGSFFHSKKSAALTCACVFERERVEAGAKGHMAWPANSGWRVMRMIPVSQRCIMGTATALTSFRLKTVG